MSQHGASGWCDHSSPTGGAPEQQAGQQEEGLKNEDECLEM